MGNLIEFFSQAGFSWPHSRLTYSINFLYHQLRFITVRIGCNLSPLSKNGNLNIQPNMLISMLVLLIVLYISGFSKEPIRLVL